MKFMLIWILYSGGTISEMGKITNLKTLSVCKNSLKDLQTVADFKNRNHPDLPELEMRGTCVEDIDPIP